MLLSAGTMNILISEPNKVHHRNEVATDSTIWAKQACTNDTLWRHSYITTGKEYSTNSQILLKYCELVLLQVQMVNISCKSITIRLSYKRNKKAPFMKHRVHVGLRVISLSVKIY